MPKKKGNEVQLARGRLKGVLQDLVAPSDDESDESEKKYQPLPRGRPPKKMKKLMKNEVQGPIYESFVMKLFDRSIDLAKYREDTPLYPICRAWIANQPRSATIKREKKSRSPSPEMRDKNGDILKRISNGEIDEVHCLPELKKAEIERVPSPLLTESRKEDINLDYDQENPPVSREDLMTQHKERWCKVRNKWVNHSKEYKNKYSLSFQLLEMIYRP